MSDFLFCNKINYRDKVTISTRQYLNVLPNAENEIFSGPWGNVGVVDTKTNYLHLYENDSTISVIVGNPLVNIPNQINYEVINENNISILHDYLTQNYQYDPKDIFDGQYTILIIDKNGQGHRIITDLLGFIPVYIYQNNETIVIGTHVDMVARAAGVENDYDIISAADFIINETICYPYTLYSHVRQLQPGSIYKITIGSNVINIHNDVYYLPEEKNNYKTILDAAEDLRYAFSKNVKAHTENRNEIGILMGAGEDSRAVIGAIPNNIRINVHTIAPAKNREIKIAQKVSDKYNAIFNYYIPYNKDINDKLISSIIIRDSQQNIGHAQFFGKYRLTKSLMDLELVFGGFMADVLLKSYYVDYVFNKKYGGLLFTKEIVKKEYDITVPRLPIKSDILYSVIDRRKLHFEYLKNIRDLSTKEWMRLYPMTHFRVLTYYSINRKLFNTCEPYMSSNVVRIAAKVPQEWKFNRKLFHLAMREYFKNTKYISDSNSRYPYFSPSINNFIKPFLGRYRKYKNSLILCKNRGVAQGAWRPWYEGVGNSINNNRRYQNKYLFSSNLVSEMLDKDIKEYSDIYFKDKELFGEYRRAIKISICEAINNELCPWY